MRKQYGDTCIRGHVLTPENTDQDGGGYLRCKVCVKVRKWEKRQRAARQAAKQESH